MKNSAKWLLLLVVVALGLGFAFYGGGDFGQGFLKKSPLFEAKKPWVNLERAKLVPVERKARTVDLEKLYDEFVKDAYKLTEFEVKRPEPEQEDLTLREGAFEGYTFPEPEKEEYIRIYSDFPDCTDEVDAEWCDEDGKQLIFQENPQFEGHIEAANFRICLEGRDATTANLEQVTFEWRGTGRPNGSLIVDRQRFDIVMPAWNSTTLDFEQPIALTTEECVAATVLLEGSIDYEETSYFSSLLNGLDTAEGLLVTTDQYEGLGKFVVFAAENLITIRRNDYRGEERVEGRGSNVHFGAYNVCSHDNRYGTLGYVDFAFDVDGATPFNVIAEGSYWNHVTREHEDHETRFENVVAGGNYRLELPDSNFVHEECFDVYLRTDGAPAEDINRLQAMISGIGGTDDTSIWHRNEVDWDLDPLELPLRLDPWVIEDGEPDVGSADVIVEWIIPSLRNERHFTAHGKGQECLGVGDFTEEYCHVLRTRAYFDGPMEWHQNLDVNAVEFTIESDRTESFEAEFIISHGDFDPDYLEEITVNEGINEFSFQFDEDVDFGSVFMLMVRVPEGEDLDDRNTSFFRYGTLDFTLESIDVDLVSEELNTRADVNVLVYGPSEPGGEWEEFERRELPYTGTQYGIDDHKLLIEPHRVGLDFVSLSQYEEDGEPLILFSGNIENLRGSVYIKRAVFAHNIDKEAAPGLLELNIGGERVIPTEWVRSSLVSFEFAENNRPRMRQYGSYIEVSLVNPDDDIIDTQIDPAYFDLIELEVVAEEDLRREDPVLPMIISTFNGNDAIQLSEDNPVPGPRIIFEE